MKVVTIFCGLASITTVSALSSLDYNVLAPRSADNTGFNVRKVDIDEPRPLLPRTSQGANPSPSPSPAPGTRQPNPANQGLPLPTVRSGSGQRSSSRSREGEASVNSSPVRERPQSPIHPGIPGPGDRLGNMPAGEGSASRERQAQVLGERNPIRPVAQPNAGLAPSQPVQNENERYRGVAQGFAQRWNIPQNDQGLPHRPHSLDLIAKQHAATQQLLREARPRWAVPGINPVRPDPIDPNHPVNIMPGMAQRIARGPMGPPNNRAQAGRGAARGQAGGNEEWGAAFAHVLDANRGRGRGRAQAQQRAVLPNPPASPSTASEQDQYRPPESPSQSH